MSKPKKARKNSVQKGKDTMIGKQMMPLAIGVIVIVAIVAVAVYFLLMPGTGASPAGTSGITGTGTGACGGDRKFGLGILHRDVFQWNGI